ncbi:MAG: hypothetical protein ACRDJ1_10110 [Actinomycetota bacterium]
MNAVERDGSVFVISRYGRMVALITPLPERVILEFDDGAPAPSPVMPVVEPDFDIDELELTELACQFIIDAASTPTGFWNAPGAAFAAEPREFFRTLFDLDVRGLTESRGAGLRRITRQGRKVAQALVRAGHKGYEETHPPGYHPDDGTDEEVA